MKYKVLVGAVMAAAIAMANEPGKLPEGWLRAGDGTAKQNCAAATDSLVVSRGQRSLALKCNTNETGFVTVMQQFGAQEYRGQRVRFSASVRADSVEKWGGLWMRIDGDKSPAIAFDNMQSRPIRGTKNWNRYEVTLDVANDAAGIAFGMLLEGGGRLWMDDIKVDVVGNEVAVTGMALASKRKPMNLDLSQ